MMGPLCEHRWRREIDDRIRSYHQQAARDGELRAYHRSATAGWRGRLADTLRRLADGLEPIPTEYDAPPALHA